MNLLPCPFCGSRNVQTTTAYFGGFVQCYVKCLSCEANGPYPVTTGDEREAVVLWNTRRDTEPDSDD